MVGLQNVEDAQGMEPVKSRAFAAAGQKKSRQMDKNDAMIGISSLQDMHVIPGGGSTSGQPQTSDLEGGAGTPLQVWLARPETWRGVYVE